MLDYLRLHEMTTGRSLLIVRLASPVLQLTLLCGASSAKDLVLNRFGLRSVPVVEVHNDRVLNARWQSLENRYCRHGRGEHPIRFVAAFVRRPVVPAFIVSRYRYASEPAPRCYVRRKKAPLEGSSDDYYK